MSFMRGLTARLVLGILGGCLVLYVAILVDVHHKTRAIVLDRAHDQARLLHRDAAGRLTAALRPVEEIPERLARVLGTTAIDRATLDDVLRLAIANNPGLLGLRVILDPALSGRGAPPFAARWFRRGGEPVRESPAAGPTSPPEPEWYRKARLEGRPLWSEPHLDPESGGVVLTRVAPIAAGASGVVAVDVSLAWLQDDVASIKVERTGFAFVVSRSGLFLAHPDRDLILTRTVNDVARAVGNAALSEAAQRMTRGESGFVRAVSPRTGRPGWFFYGPLPAVDGSFGVLFPENEIAADVDRLDRRMAWLGAGGAIGLTLIVVLLSVRITGPLRRLAGATRAVATGRLDADLPAIRSRDEVGQLTSDFRQMQRSLARYIEDQRRTAADAERLESQLRIAREIQIGILPADPSAVLEGTGLEIHVVLHPAQQVGGDLYDVLRLGDDRLAVVVGDVSGKGIPASLFMAMSSTLVRNAARRETRPDEILRQVNDELVASNPRTMFVTLQVLIVDPRDGRVTAATAGHLPAVLLGDGAPRFVFPSSGRMAGIFPDLKVQSETLMLEAGQTLVLYSDGVTEAFDPAEELFGDDRLLARLAERPGRNAAETVESVLEAVRHHAGSAPQSDDITILALRRLPSA
jgi:sigma-B regulation protein RsbU (phosphoserine phosphatase)